MKTAIALGTFDGLHLGHRAVLSKTEGFFRVAYTFEIPPKSVISGNPELLMLPDDRRKALLDFGMDKVVMNDFENIRNLSAEEFLNAILNEYNPARITCGFNYKFGRGALGDTQMLARFCEQNGIEFVCCDSVGYMENALSSTVIRSLIKTGEIEAANGLIYNGFSFSGEVLDGDKRGRRLGFPTINQEFPELLVKPKFGVYVVEVLVGGKIYEGIANIGHRPTFKTECVASETYIKDFSGDIYGQTVKITIKKFLREEKKFHSIDELKAAIENDVKAIKELYI